MFRPIPLTHSFSSPSQGTMSHRRALRAVGVSSLRTELHVVAAFRGSRILQERRRHGRCFAAALARTSPRTVRTVLSL